MYGAMIGFYEVFKDMGFSPNMAAVLSAVPEGLIKGPLDAHKIIQMTGATSSLRVYLKGTAAMLVREVPGNFVYFGTYRNIKPRLEAQGYAGTGTNLLSGGLAGSAFVLCTYPIDTARVQIVTGKAVHEIKLTYKGCGVQMVRASILTAALFASYEYIAAVSRKRLGQE